MEQSRETTCELMELMAWQHIIAMIATGPCRCVESGTR